VRSVALLALVVGLLLVTAVVSPWVLWGLLAAIDHPFTLARVYNRVLEVLLVLALPLLWRRLDLGDLAAIGLRRPRWRRELAQGVLVGLAGVAAALALCGVAGALVPGLRFALGKTVRKALLGAAGAILIGVGEEALFRGVLLRRLAADFGRPEALAVTTAVYAVVHAIGKGGLHGPVDAWSGFARTAALWAPLGASTAWPQVFGLLLLGLVLAVARLQTGSLWVSIGLHAAWVAVFRIGRLLFAVRPRPVWLVGPGWPPLIGGVAGWLGVGVSALVLALWLRPRGGGRRPR
jgi:hypothetical protein